MQHPGTLRTKGAPSGTRTARAGRLTSRPAKTVQWTVFSPRESPRCVAGRQHLTGATRCTIPFGAGSAFARALRFASRGPVAKNAPLERFLNAPADGAPGTALRKRRAVFLLQHPGTLRTKGAPSRDKNSCAGDRRLRRKQGAGAGAAVAEAAARSRDASRCGNRNSYSAGRLASRPAKTVQWTVFRARVPPWPDWWERGLPPRIGQPAGESPMRGGQEEPDGGHKVHHPLRGGLSVRAGAPLRLAGTGR